MIRSDFFTTNFGNPKRAFWHRLIRLYPTRKLSTTYSLALLKWVGRYSVLGKGGRGGQRSLIRTKSLFNFTLMGERRHEVFEDVRCGLHQPYPSVALASLRKNSIAASAPRLRFRPTTPNPVFEEVEEERSKREERGRGIRGFIIP